MLSFLTRGGASFSFGSDFSDENFANISFFGDARRSILFHLSLRFEAGLVVANRRVEGVWQREHRREVTLARSGDRTQISFDGAGNVGVALNGHEIFAFGSGEFPDLGTIAQVNFRGGLVGESIEIGGAANQRREGLGELVLADGLELAGWAVDPGLPQQSPVLTIENLEEPILFDLTEKPEIAARHKLTETRIGVTALLPGRVWLAAAGDDDDLVIGLSNNGIACGAPLRLSRKDVAARIGRMTAEADPGRETKALLSALEHVRFGGLWELLPDQARAVLKQTAGLYGLEEYLAEAIGRDGPGTDGSETAAAIPAMPAPNPDALLVDKLRGRFAAALATDDPRPPSGILQALLAEFPLGPGLRRQLYLAVTEAFCNADAFADLHALAAAEGLAGFEPNGKTWHDSVITPFLCLSGRLEVARQILWELSQRRQGWVVTPALSWSLRWLFDARMNGVVEEKQREDFLYAFLALVKAEASSYWGRAPCVAMMDATIVASEARGRLADYARDELERAQLAAYGLSHRFWAQMRAAREAGRIVASPVMQAADAAFALIEARLGGGAAQAGPDPAVQAALDVFAAYGNADVGRFRLELFGPAGSELPLGDALLIDLMRRPGASQERMLRAFAFPGLPAAGDAVAPQTVLALRETVQRSNPGVGVAPYYRQQVEVSRAVQALLDRMRAGEAADPALLADIQRRFELLASRRSGHIGIGMALALIGRLAELGDEDGATRFLAQVTWVIGGLPEAHRHELFAQPSIRGALSGLARNPGARANSVVAAALRMFPRFDAGALSLPEAADDGLRADPWFDTIVTVFSCEPFLGTRAEAMRKGWLSRLDALGVPYVIVVGNGDGRREGDVVRLDAPDDYEGLPQKTLKAVEWVFENTPFGHMLKIDDDCFLNADEYFHSLSYRKFDFYGRRVSRPLGGMDRLWHNEKSTSARGRLELDKSPEPSEYCDGGSGYSLSRTAMAALLDQAASPEGRALISTSFMEDKMVGDLLARAGIAPGDEDYHVAVQRRTHAEAIPVSRWENGFHPTRLAGTKLVHLDTHETQGAVMNRQRDTRLWPPKIWPTWTRARLGAETNLIELVSDEDKLADLVHADLAVVSCLRNEMFMLPAFLAHYRKLGVKAFLIVDNCSDDGSLEYLRAQPDVALFSADTPYGKSHYGVAWQQALLAAFRVGRWTLLADADELLVYRGWEKTPLARRLAGKGLAGADAVRTYMLDMYPEGALSQARFGSGDPFAEAGFAEAEPFLRTSAARGPYSNSPTVTSALRHRLIPGSRPELFVAQKYALLRYQPWMRLSQGLHYVAETRVAEEEMIFAHFKYNAHFRAKAQAEVARGEHFNGAEEYRKYLALVSEGREVIFDEEVSRPWREVGEVRRILGK